MSIVFVDPPSPPGFVAFRHAHGGYGECCRTSRLKFPTLDLFHGASLLLKRGIAAAVVDSVLMDHSPRQCVDAVLRHKPSLVVLRLASGSCPQDLLLARRLKSRFIGPVLCYGPQVAAEPERILASPGVDAVLPGEGPPRLTGRSWRQASGVWHKRAGRVVKNPPAPAMDLDALPVPRWDLVDFRRYSYVTTQTSWGCPEGCGYCPYPVTQGRRWRTRSTTAVVREFLALRQRYSLRFVLLRDPNFTWDRDRAAALCHALITAGTPLLWGCESRLESLDEGLLDLMARAGCIRVAFGVDSLNPETLKLMGRRPCPPAEVRATVARLKRRGMLTYAMYIIGLPAETAGSTRRLIDFALALDTDAASFSLATPFPGTALASWARKQGCLATKDPLHLTSCVPSLRNEHLTHSQLENLYLSAKRRWQEQRSREHARCHA